jgi:hybrid cluster-associated redox disulfide protein
MEDDYWDLSVTEIMRRWPQTIGVFIDLDLYCIGCPLGGLHKPLDAALEHGIPYDLLLAELATAVAGVRTRAVRARDRRQSAGGGADP